MEGEGGSCKQKSICNYPLGKIVGRAAVCVGVIVSVLTVAIIVLAIKKSKDPIDYGILKAGFWSALAGVLAGAIGGLILWLLCRYSSGFRGIVAKGASKRREVCMDFNKLVAKTPTK